MSASDLKKPSETNWTRVDAMSDEEIDTSDIPSLDETFFANAKLRVPDKVSVPVRTQGLAMITIDDVIREREPYFVRESATVLEAAKFMTNLNIGAVCVLDDEGRLRGIFSERAVLRRVVIAGKDPATTQVGEIMSIIKAVIECRNTPHEALELMEQHGTRYLPVVRDKRWVGMLAMRDIMRVELGEQGDELRLLHEYIQQ